MDSKERRDSRTNLPGLGSINAKPQKRPVEATVFEFIAVVYQTVTSPIGHRRRRHNSEFVKTPAEVVCYVTTMCNSNLFSAEIIKVNWKIIRFEHGFFTVLISLRVIYDPKPELLEICK